jgi:hypothetical protein
MAQKQKQPNERHEFDLYRIALDKKWALADFSDFPRVYDQVYAFLFASEADLSGPQFDRVSYVFRAYPWHGGYSTVNFYQNLRATIPSPYRPQIKAIRYSSPGWMDLSLLVSVAISIRVVVHHFAKAGKQLNDLYSDIYKGIHERKLQEIEIRKKEIEIKETDLAFANKSCEALAKLLGFSDLQKLHDYTGNPIASLKMLLSFYRRVRTIAKFEQSGMIDLGGGSDENEKPH